MRWKKGKRTPAPASTAGQSAADKALGKAEARLERAQDDTHEILAVTEHLMRLGERNDFAQRIKEALGGV
jgi:hypothetical protein